MDSRKRRKRRNEDTISCECGCGTSIYKYGTDGRVRRFSTGHQFKGNAYGRKEYSLDAILDQAEVLRPFCACGCGDKLDLPAFLQRKGAGIISIKSYWQEHPYKKKHGIWDTRTVQFIADSEELDAETLGLIYGTLLGDGALTYPNPHSRFPRLSWTHGIKQQDWMAHKASRLSALRPTLRITSNAGYGDVSVCCQTFCHPSLKPVSDVIKPTGDCKTVSEEWLCQITLEGLAWWYMDDGSLSLTPHGCPQIQFHTEGYSAEENQLIAGWVTRLGYSAKVRSYKRASSGKPYFYTAMGADASRKWLSDLKPFSIPSMEYKFGDDRICSPRWS